MRDAPSRLALALHTAVCATVAEELDDGARLNDSEFLDLLAKRLALPPASFGIHGPSILQTRVELLPFVRLEKFQLRGKSAVTGSVFQETVSKVLRLAPTGDSVDERGFLNNVASELCVDVFTLEEHSADIAFTISRSKEVVHAERVRERLFEGGPISRTCLACVWSTSSLRPVLCQCEKPRVSGQDFCRTHLEASSRQKHGYWSLQTGVVAGSSCP